MRAGHLTGSLVIAILLPLMMGGCGPTSGELLTYEMVVVAAGLGLGMGTWGIGYRLGGRIFGQWFVCSHCLVPQVAGVGDGDRQACCRCGQESTVNVLDRATAMEVIPKAGLRAAWGRGWRWTAGLTGLTAGVLAGLSLVFHGLDLKESNLQGLPEWLTLPIAYCFRLGESGSGIGYPGLGCGLFFFSYQFGNPVDKLMTLTNAPEQVCMAVLYGGILSMIDVHWHIGLRRWRWGWLLPIGVAVVNTVAAIIGYVLAVPRY